MKRRLISILPFLSLVLAGCSTPRHREIDAEAGGYERGYRQAVKDQYWIIQNQQRPIPPSSSSDIQPESP